MSTPKGVGEDRREQGAVFGEFPEFEPAPTRSSATTCRGAAATAWSIATARSSPRRTLRAGQRRACSAPCRTSSFTAWNVERIRPETLEPFNFEEANMSDELWLGGGLHAVLRRLDHGAPG